MYDFTQKREYILIPSADGALVRKKVYAGNPVEFQRRLHRLSQTILRDDNNFTILRTPHLYEHQDYWMEHVDVRYPVYLGDSDSTSILSSIYPSLLNPLTQELKRYWIQMWDHGYSPYGFELYVQPDGSVVLLDFDTYGSRTQETRPVFPEHFFQHPCFPPDFKYQLESHFQVPPDF